MSQNKSNTKVENLANSEMAIRLQNHHFETPASDANFKRALKERLLAQYEHHPTQRSWRWALAVGMVVLVIIFGLFWPFQEAQPVSAAELLQLSSEALSAQAAGADIIYDRLLLEWDMMEKTAYSSAQSGIEAELWVYPEKFGLRYQLKKDEVYYYFEQHLGDQHWESLHNQPVGQEPVTYIYASTAIPYAKSLQGASSDDNLIYGDYVNAWLNWGSLALERQQTCDDLFCLIGINTDLDWECQQQTCTQVHSIYQNDEIIGTVVIQAEIIGLQHQDGQDDLYVIEITDEGFEQYGSTTIKINARTYMLVEIVTEFDYPHWGIYYFKRLQLLERRGLTADEVPQDLFSTPPQELEVREWEGSLWAKRKPQIWPNPKPADQVWLISLSPQPETRLDGKVNFQVELGYELVSLPEAALEVSFRQHPMRVSQAVTAGAGTATFDLVLDADELITGELRMYGRLVTFIGAESSKDLSTYRRGLDEDPHLGRWCVRCNPDGLTPIPPPERRGENDSPRVYEYGSPLVNLVTVGEPPEGYQITSMELVQKRVVIAMTDPENRDLFPEMIDTIPLNLSELTKSGRYQIDLVIPEGIEIRGDPIQVEGDPFIFVDIVVEPLGETP